MHQQKQKRKYSHDPKIIQFKFKDNIVIRNGSAMMGYVIEAGNITLSRAWGVTLVSKWTQYPMCGYSMISYNSIALGPREDARSTRGEIVTSHIASKSKAKLANKLWVLSTE